MSESQQRSDANQNYSRRVDDLIEIVQQTIKDVDDFVKGRLKVEPHEYQKVKRDLMARQSMAMDAMLKAMDGQRELLSTMKTTGEPIPQRRADDQAAPLRSVESIEEELFDIKLRAGIK